MKIRSIALFALAASAFSYNQPPVLDVPVSIKVLNRSWGRSWLWMPTRSQRVKNKVNRLRYGR